MIVKRINKYEFREAFEVMDWDQFTEAGYEALYEYLEDLSEDTGEPIELDPVAICYEFTEYESLDEIIEDYRMDDLETLEDLEYYTTVIKFDGGIIIQDF